MYEILFSKYALCDMHLNLNVSFPIKEHSNGISIWFGMRDKSFTKPVAMTVAIYYVIRSTVRLLKQFLFHYKQPTK